MHPIIVLLTVCSLFWLTPVFGETNEPGRDTYQQYCAGCHDTGTGNAPRRSDTDYWKKRLQVAIGRSALTNTVITGKGAMPAKGGCTDCTEEMLQNAVLYLINDANNTSTASADTPDDPFPLETLKLPAGFSIKVFADKLPGARFMAQGDDGTIFVGSKGFGNVYAVIPNKDGTGIARKLTLLSELDEPNGVAFHQGALYVAEVGRILRYDDIEDHLEQPPEPVIVKDNLPSMRWHGYKTIDVGPDNKLYVAIGMPCNTCNYRQTNPLLGTIMRMKLDGNDFEPYAIGIRNSVGFTWHPESHALWFSDNGQDLLGDNTPPDEINYAPKAHMDFGFPYVFGHNIIAPDYTTQHINTANFTPPAFALPAHVAPLGVRFYTGQQFPKEYQNQLFVALHGSWNRSKKTGYEILMLTVEGDRIVKSQPFVTGWLQGQEAWGRPVHLLVQPDGSLLISDDFKGAIYQVTYEKR